MKHYTTTCPEETIDIGYQLGKTLDNGSVVCFFGDLAAGKTTFIKGLIAGATGCPSETVNSPTFVYLNIYEGIKTVHHFDLYRLDGVDEFIAKGFDDHLFSNAICCIEWSERIEGLLSHGYTAVTLAHIGADKRTIVIERK